jgi:hypothetical protein
MMPMAADDSHKTSRDAGDWRPTFVGIGAAKCATTWCWEALRHHPDVDAGQPKEIDFFRLHFDRSTAWYAKHFRRADARVRGEITPVYMDDARVAERIAATYPDVTLLVVLRNPYERALSNLLHDVRDLDGGVTGASEARARELAAREPKFLRRSLYAAQLRSFVERFDRTQFAVLFYEDLERDARGFLRQLYAAVGADVDFVPPQWEAPVNRTRDYRWPAAFKALQMASRSANALPGTRAAMQWLYRRTRLREWALDRLSAQGGRPTFAFERVFGAEAQARVAADVCELSALLGIELPASWSAPLGCRSAAA